MSASEYYYIVSQMSGLALDVEQGHTTPGTKVSPWQKNGTDAQLWIDDPGTGTIRTKLNGYCMDIKDGVLVINPYSSGVQSQQWNRLCHLVSNGANYKTVLDIQGSNPEPRTPIITYTYYDQPNQKWYFELTAVKKDSEEKKDSEVKKASEVKKGSEVKKASEVKQVK